MPCGVFSKRLSLTSVGHAPHLAQTKTGQTLHNWLATRVDRPASYANTCISIVVFVLLNIVFFYVFNGAAIFFGNSKPRLQTFVTIGMSAGGALAVLLFFGPPRLPQPRRFSLPVLWLITILICAVIAFYSFASYAWSGDEYAYLFEADTFKALRLWNTPPPLGTAETTSYIWIKDGKWVAQYPPGWPLILALFGGSLPTGRLANGVCTVIAAYAVYELVKIRANRESAWLTVLFFALSPFALFNGGALFSNTMSAATIALTMLVSFKAKNSTTPALLLLLLGLCIGITGITRNVSALTVLIAVIVDQYRAANPLRRIVLISIGGAPCLAGLLIYQYTITGHAMMPVYWYAGRTLDHLYFDWDTIKQAPRLTTLKFSELMVFTSPLVLLLWLPSLWQVLKTRTFSASDLIMPLGVFIFVFYPLDPYYRAGPRYYYDFWPMAVVTIGAAVPRFSDASRKLYRGLLGISIVYAIAITPFLIVVLHSIIHSRFDLYEVVSARGLKNALVCNSSNVIAEDVYERQEYWGTARNGIDIGDPVKAAQKDVIFVNCPGVTVASLRAAYPGRTLWDYKTGNRKYPGRLELMHD